MKLKTYFGKTLQDAMNQAKAELGEDVVILESREARGNGFFSKGEDLVQITAAVDDGNNGKLRNGAVSVFPGNGDQKHFEKYLSSMMPHQGSDFEHEMNMAHEVATLRHELSKLNRRLRKMTSPDFPEPFSNVYEKLLETGISEEHVASFVRRAFLKLDGEISITREKILKTIESEVFSFFVNNVSVETGEETKQRIVAVIGPTGVGKTTTIMKLALHPEVYGKKEVAIISTDTYRVAASEPLKAFSRIASIPVVEVRNPDEVNAQIEKLKDRDIILVDTPGRSPFFPSYIQELDKYLDAFKPTDILLVLSMTADLEDIYLFGGLYFSLNPTGVVLTKIDETSRPGKIISMVEEIGLPVTYICDGQAIPNDVRKASGEYVWKKILKSM